MKEKALALLTCIFMSLSILGFVYAQWNDVIVVRNRMTFGTLTIRFTTPLKYWDNDDATKDVGKLDCYYTDPDPVEGYKTLIILIDNAYPSYEAHCNFTLKNIGSLTSRIVAISILDPTGELNWIWTVPNTEGFLWEDFNENGAYDPNEEIMNFTITNLIDVELDPSESIEAKIVVHITDNAQECQTYSFEVEINYEDI